MERNIGTISNPGKTYFIDCEFQDFSIDHLDNLLVHLLDNYNWIRKFQVERHDLYLLLSDDARYFISLSYM